MSTIDRWKILDNLRRSLLRPALLVLFVAGWSWLPGSALVWTLAGILMSAMPIFAGIATMLRHGLLRASLTTAARSIWTDTARWLLSLVFLPYEALITMDAVVTTLVRLVITRRYLLQWTTTAHTSRLFDRETKPGLFWRQMGGASLLALGLTCLLVLSKPASLPAAAPLLLVWIISPYIAYRISQPAARGPVRLTLAQRRQLRRLARRTWLYFERFANQDDHWLPVDRFQEEPLELTAHCTSPTNMGLLLLCTLAAYDLGYLGPLDLTERLHSTFKSMEQLERYRGHFLNWYDTHSLRPMSPRYVSTVDSGNLAGCLLALEHGCRSLSRDPILRWRRWEGMLDTLDVLARIVEDLTERALLNRTAASLQNHLARIRQQVSSQKVGAIPCGCHCGQMQDLPLPRIIEKIRQQVLAVQDNPGDWAALLTRLIDSDWQELKRLLDAPFQSSSQGLDADPVRDLNIWSERLYHQLVSMQDEINTLAPWLAPLGHPPALFNPPANAPAINDAWHALVESLRMVPKLEEMTQACRAAQVRLNQLQALLTNEIGSASRLQQARDWCVDLAAGLDAAQSAAQALLASLQDLSAQAEACFLATDFRFLFNSRRQVFHTGYNVEAEKLDISHLDLLACEARIASLLAIATGQVPMSHWLHLARPITQINGRRTLLSWGGTMLEYLMPSLLIQGYERTLLRESSRAAIGHQIAYARRRGVPWGVSESGCSRLDIKNEYQYRTFGVPGLGLKRDPDKALVISPYASLLALPLYPRDVMQNVERLVELQLLGRYGFYEAIDYTDSWLPPEQESTIVRSYMAHHQGMILLSLTNFLQDEVMVRRFHADLCVQSVQLLLHEGIPYQAPVEYPDFKRFALLTRPTVRSPLRPGVYG
jgi:cyclic beta-1,2-glucan synthetase